MAKLEINLLGWNHKAEIGKSIESVLRQTYSDFELIYTDNASTDGSVDFVKKIFPQINIIANSVNLGYAGAHNRFFRQSKSEFVMVLNPDVELDKNFLEEALKVFTDPKVAAVTGKMLLPRTKILDGTGIVVSRSRRARERGQHEEDNGKYDNKLEVFGVSGTAAIYRNSALDAIKIPKLLPLADTSNKIFLLNKEGLGEVYNKEFEYIDEDFFAYFDDMDLSWRFRLAGYKCKFTPKAIVYHSRKASSSTSGYNKVGEFIKHHKGLSQNIKRWNWKNHLFCIIKNDFGWPLWRDLPFILLRELAMFVFILVFETRTLGAVPQFFRELPVMLKKRQYIQSHRQVDSKVAGEWFK